MKVCLVLVLFVLMAMLEQTSEKAIRLPRIRPPMQFPMRPRNGKISLITPRNYVLGRTPAQIQKIQLNRQYKLKVAQHQALTQGKSTPAKRAPRQQSLARQLTPAPRQPTLAPRQPSPAKQPTPAPRQPSPASVTSTLDPRTNLAPSPRPVSQTQVQTSPPSQHVPPRVQQNS